MEHLQAIQMIGIQRSGSNLLRLLLDQYPEVAAPHPPHILQRLMPLLPLYGNLAEPANLSHLADDVCRLIETNPVPWTDIRLDRQELAAACRQPTLVELFRLVYEQLARQRGARMWLCKSLANIRYAPELEMGGLRPKYIYLYRDGRDVACSFRKAVVGEKHVYHLAQAWKAAQMQCLELEKRIMGDRFISLRYEHLIHRPEAEFSRLTGFLGLDYDPAVFRYYESDESKKTSSAGRMWENVTKPILSGNSNKFRSELGEEEILIFEAVAGDMLETLGYELLFPEEARMRRFSQQELDVFEVENKALKEQALQQLDPEGMKLRQKQQELLEQIKKEEKK